MTDKAVDLEQYKLDQAENGLREKLFDFTQRPEIQNQIGEAFYIWKNDPELTSDDLRDEDIDELTFTKFFDWFLYDFKLIDSGKRIIERFYEEEKESLTQAEKKITEDWLRNLHSFFEVKEKPSEEEFKIKDIFTGEELKVKDSASAEQISAYDIISGRPVKTGGNNYFSAVISIYPRAFKSVIMEYFETEFSDYKEHYGKKRTKKEYLKDWGYLIERHIEEIVRNPRYVTSDGDELSLASSVFEVEDYSKALNKLRAIDSLTEIRGGTDELRVFSWQKDGGNKLSGAVELGEKLLKIECHSKELLGSARGMIENKLKGLISHREDSVRQFGTFLPETVESEETGDLPPGVRSRHEMDERLDEYYREWMETPHRALDGKTPEEAVRTKAGKKKLNSLLAELEKVYKHSKQRGEPYYDVEKIREKLGLG